MKRKGFIRIKDGAFYDILTKLVADEFGMPYIYAKNVVHESLEKFVSRLRDDIAIYVETEYVDKVYRDSYYGYYSSKALKYSRNCIRLSLFDNSSNEFCSGIIAYGQGEKIRKAYQGFIVLRPTMPKLIGRSAISRSAFKDNQFVNCAVSIASSVDGHKVNVEAFPSSSQDTESITCAETSLWALMEYYGNKYPEYTPIKPSHVIEALRNKIDDRQLPSNGLSAECLTYAIKSFGFGPCIYHKDAFPDLHNILGCYVESGIPVVVALSNQEAFDNKKVSKYVGHAVICIGHEIVSPSMIDNAEAVNIESYATQYGNISLLDYDNIEKRFVFIDDNFPPYQLDKLARPTGRYGDAQDWKACRIESIIVPLYDKIYMESYLAKEYLKSFIATPYFSYIQGRKIAIRIYLSSTRSYRAYVNDSSMSIEMKTVISNLFMPKFVWVAEVSDIGGLKNGTVNELILLDATSRKVSYYDPLLVAFANQTCYIKDTKTNALYHFSVKMNKFHPYSNIR